MDTKLLAAELKRKLRGEVRFDAGSRALYSTDGSNYRQVPIGAVIPRDEDDVIHTVRVCREFDAPVLARGGGTSLAGQCCNAAVVMDMTKYMHRIIELNPDERYAWVQPGIINDSLRHAAEKHRLTFGPDPATHNRCTIGGNIGNNSCGIHSVAMGKTSENIEELEILTYEGDQMRVGRTSEEELEEIIRGGGRRGALYARLKTLRDRYADEIREKYPRIPRRVSGYNLDKLLPEAGFHVAQALVGSECTLVTVLAAKTRLVHSPPFRTLLVIGYEDIFHAGDHVPQILEFQPLGLEALDDRFIRDMKVKGLHPRDLELMPEGGGWLLTEFGGDTKEEADDKAHRAMDALRRQARPPHLKLFTDKTHEHMVWEIRESGLGATAYVPGQKENWEGWEDSAVPPAAVGDYLRSLRKLLDSYGYQCCLYGHLGDGCVHTRIDFELKTAEGIRQYRSFMSEAVDLVLSFGGSLSGEHGDGQSRAEFLPRMFGHKIIEAFNEYKTIWDPQWRMNPGKVVHPYKIDENLRYGAAYRPATPQTHFKFHEDHSSFARAMERCVGVGECRRLDGGTMCPSYMATREEMHSTRGRMRLLFEMLQGDPLTKGWKDDHVKEALDLCLSCKGCKGDCPVNVDVATYKAEFLSHYYAGRLRPRSAYASGLIHWWARLASRMPALANFVTQAPGLSAAARFAAGYSQKRRLPPFAYETFQEWFRKRAPRNPGKAKVVLWPDTFNNFFQPEVAKAAVEVLEEAGCQVEVPRQNVCCGRPLYDYGMLGLARSTLLDTIAKLRPYLEDGTPIVGLEPSCVSVFRDEMPDLLWGNEDARRLTGQVFLFSEFLKKKAPGYRPPVSKRHALVHGHCHHKALFKMNDEEALLKDMGLDYRMPDTGCCGMAGAFGYENGDHYDVSIACGERVLIPAVRSAPDDALIVADGFSCREQIEQTTGRQALHLAQVMRIAETGAAPARAPMPLRLKIKWTAIAAAAIGVLGWRCWRRR